MMAYIYDIEHSIFDFEKKKIIFCQVIKNKSAFSANNIFVALTSLVILLPNIITHFYDTPFTQAIFDKVIE